MIRGADGYLHIEPMYRRGGTAEWADLGYIWSMCKYPSAPRIIDASAL